jgi:hypothetical protein
MDARASATKQAAFDTVSVMHRRTDLLDPRHQRDAEVDARALHTRLLVERLEEPSEGRPYGVVGRTHPHMRDGSDRHVDAACSTQHDTTRHDTTRHDTTRHDTTRHDTTRHDTTRHDTRGRRGAARREQ